LKRWQCASKKTSLDSPVFMEKPTSDYAAAFITLR
jgi:hypothetical protein